MKPTPKAFARHGGQAELAGPIAKQPKRICQPLAVLSRPVVRLIGPGEIAQCDADASLRAYLRGRCNDDSGLRDTK
jgi:hypothetical protein